MSPDASLFDDIAPAGGDPGRRPATGPAVRARLDSEGIALTSPLLSEAECQEARGWFDDPGRFRSTVVMQRYGFGRGTYRYLADPLPGLVRELREWLYRPLARIANDWADQAPRAPVPRQAPRARRGVRRGRPAQAHAPDPALRPGRPR